MADSNPKVTKGTIRKSLEVAAMLAGIVGIGLASGGLKPRGQPTDYIFFWCFVIFAVGFAELFVIFLALTILGKVDLAKAFQDKELVKPSDATKPSVSLSRLQAFFWTLIIMIVFFHEAVVQGGIPTLQPELLLVMGISGAVYLAGKSLSVESAKPPPGQADAPPKPDPAADQGGQAGADAKADPADPAADADAKAHRADPAADANDPAKKKGG